MIKNKLGALAIFCLGAFFTVAFFWPGSGGTWIELVVTKGETARQVAGELKSKGLLTSRTLFLAWTRIRRGEAAIKPGHYRFSKGRSAFWIVDDMINGRTIKIKFIIPEGYASWQIAERIETMGLCNGNQFLKYVQDKKLEGFLFPATYEFDLGYDPATLTKKMTDEFDKRWTPDFEAQAKESGFSKLQIVTLASILEREIRVRDELPLISAVYHNRLKKNMHLDADPTVQYAMGFWKHRLTYDDYRNAKSPYNTYLVYGLPPGPICSPGWEAIKAALWPADSNALYFLAQEDGHHTFSDNYREHTNKINRRNRLIRQKKNNGD